MFGRFLRDRGLTFLSLPSNSPFNSARSPTFSESARAFYVLGAIMSRRCDLLDTGPMSGNNVSHSKVHTRRRFEVNLCNVTLMSDTLGQKYRLRIAAKTLRTVDFKGGLDAFLLGTKNHKLTDKAKKIKKAVLKSQAEVEAA